MGNTIVRHRPRPSVTPASEASRTGSYAAEVVSVREVTRLLVGAAAERGGWPAPLGPSDQEGVPDRFWALEIVHNMLLIGTSLPANPGQRVARPVAVIA